MMTTRGWLVGLVAATLLGACAESGKIAVLDPLDAASDGLPEDSGAPDTISSPDGSAEETVVPPDCEALCAGKQCGSQDKCACGTCAEGEVCNDDFQCEETCHPLCENPETGEVFECGPDGCGGACGTCGGDAVCEGHHCVVVDPGCDDLCKGTECGMLGECECGSCEPGFLCMDGVCEPEVINCDEACGPKDCGLFDGCDCGTCPEGEACNDDQMCEPTGCVPACDGKVCGPDGCGGACGVCQYGGCVDGQCDCQPQCGAKQCGADGCGGSCGSCAGDEVCAWDGLCYGECVPDDVSFSATVQKVVSLSAGDGGYPGEAVDVDGDPTTCSPYGSCQGGLDNQLSGLFDSIGQFVDVDQQLESAVNDGTILLLAELVLPDYSGKSFVMNMYMGQPVQPKSTCDFQATPGCAYHVSEAAIDLEACQPQVTFDNATITDGHLTAGGLGYEFSLPLAILPGTPMVVSLHDARIEAMTVLAQQNLSLEQGVIGGALEKALLLAAVDAMPDDALPISKGMIKNLLDMMVNNDIDTNGDGQMDSASLGLKFNSIAGQIVGTY